MRRFGLFLILSLATLGLGGCASLQSTGGDQSFTFVQMCDPQIGFGGYAEDLARFSTAAEQINEMRPDLVVICGDLVNSPNEKSFRDFKAAQAKLKIPCYCAPGNHDVSNDPDSKRLEFYRQAMGKDYYSFEHKGRSFIVVNSELWRRPVAGETERQDQWLKTTLEGSARKKHPVFIITHHPPFVKTPGEPDDYFNVPPAKRKELLEMFERCGVVAILAGHTHTTRTLDYRGIQIVMSETTSRNFDHRPFGFRVWHVGSERPLKHEFVPLKGAPTE